MQVAAAVGQHLAGQRERPGLGNPEAIVQMQMFGQRRDLGDLGHQIGALQVALQRRVGIVERGAHRVVADCADFRGQPAGQGGLAPIETPDRLDADQNPVSGGEIAESGQALALAGIGVLQRVGGCVLAQPAMQDHVAGAEPRRDLDTDPGELFMLFQPLRRVHQVDAQQGVGGIAEAAPLHPGFENSHRRLQNGAIGDQSAGEQGDFHRIDAQLLGLVEK